MTTEHVSVPRELIDELVKKWKRECMGFLDLPAGIPVPKRLYLWNRVADLEAILSRATPSDECKSCEKDGVYDTAGNGPYDCYACGKKAEPSTPRVVTDADVERACSVYFGKDFWPDDVEETDLVRASVREMLEDFATSLPHAAMPDGWRQAMERALPFLDDEASKYEDDGNNEPLDVADTIRELLAAAPQAGARG
ncbi:hypothetical protein SAMN04487785_11435 [Dyella jiangningensis]|uniref:hypothetical protein n=1 Tax=Dyella sp. AtDHG13 TaxID=1938897 RepID=UPI00087F4969|nr:hypothetical protein [Dyella sp. AtDHG13]PXV54186.1 hypothetical protein BDW41_113139 [Dyella sp. AtDHG13]SDL04904.1 hypothetical protein SAMN04487785_11435 [Dyella jiangningensis]